MKDHQLHFSCAVPISRREAWQFWTTADGIRSFFSPHAACEFSPGGKFEIYFDPDAPEGMRGSEGMRILAMEEDRMFSFSWNQPPILPEIRHQSTAVIIRFSTLSAGEGGTEINLLQTGFGGGEAWQRARSYFLRAWGEIVLPRFCYAAEHGSYDWALRPELGRYTGRVRILHEQE